MGEFARSWARWEPEGIAIRSGEHFERELTWAELDRRTDAVAAVLATRGVAQGDRVAALLNNCPEFMETVIACMKLGAIFVPLNVRLSPGEIANLISHSDTRVVVTDGLLYERLAPALEGDPGITVIFCGEEPPPSTVPFAELEAGNADAAPEVATAPDDPLFLCYTSGTTGDPKGALLSHRNILQPALNQILIHEVGKSDRLFLPFPLVFTGGLISNAMLAYVAGAELVLDSAFDPARSLEVLSSQRITIFMAVPVIWQAIAALEGFDDADLSSLKVAKSGGAPVPKKLLETYQTKGIGMIQGYALTEGSGITTTLHERDALRKLGSTGIPTNGTRLRIRSESGEDLPAGEVGEVMVRGPEVMLGYWQDEAASAAALPDGWLATGDLGYLDEEGHLWIVDRKKDMFISGGLNVFPAEIERVLGGLEGIGEVAVVGVPSERWGEVAAAIVVPPDDSEPPTTETLIAHCREHLADYKVPKYVIHRAEPLPRTMSGKVLKRELAETYRDAESLESHRVQTNRGEEAKQWTSA
jgi:fatty-acyl-CoA synthase